MPVARALAASAVFVVVLLVPMAAAEAPAEAFCIVVIQALNDFQQVRIVVDEELSDVDRNASWMAADADGDGNVNEAEAGAFRADELRFWPGGEGLGNKTVTLGLILSRSGSTTGRPIYATTWRQLGHGFPGVSSGHFPLNFPLVPAALETQAVREYTFQVPGEAVHRVLSGGDSTFFNDGYPPGISIEYVVLLAPPGWSIERVDGYGYNGSFNMTGLNEEKLEIPGFDTTAPWSIQYVRHPTKENSKEDLGIPGPGVLGLAAVLALSALMSRRKVKP